MDLSARSSCSRRCSRIEDGSEIARPPISETFSADQGRWVTPAANPPYVLPGERTCDYVDMLLYVYTLRKSRAFARLCVDGRVKPGHDDGKRGGTPPHNTRLLSFTLSASRYTSPPISLNLALIWAMPFSISDRV